MKKSTPLIILLLLLFGAQESASGNYSSDLVSGDIFSWHVLEYKQNGEPITELSLDNAMFFTHNAIITLEVLVNPGAANWGSPGFPDDFFRLSIDGDVITFNENNETGALLTDNGIPNNYLLYIQLLMAVETPDGNHVFDGITEFDEYLYVEDNKIISYNSDNYYTTHDYATGVMLELYLYQVGVEGFDDIQIRVYNTSPRFSEIVNTDPRAWNEDTGDNRLNNFHKFWKFFFAIYSDWDANVCHCVEKEISFVI